MPGLRNMFMGIGLVVFGLLITGITYIIPWGFVVVAWGAMAAGGIQFVIGLFQLIAYQLKGSEGKVQAKAEASVTALLQALIATALVDGKINIEEIATIKKVYQQLVGGALETEWIQDTADSMLLEGFDIDDAMADKHWIEASLKPVILKAAYLVAVADGAINESEKKMLSAIADGLQVEKHEVHKVFNELP